MGNQTEIDTCNTRISSTQNQVSGSKAKIATYEAKIKELMEPMIDNFSTLPSTKEAIIKNSKVNRLLFNNTTWKEDTSDRNYWKPISELFGTDNLF